MNETLIPEGSLRSGDRVVIQHDPAKWVEGNLTPHASIIGQRIYRSTDLSWPGAEVEDEPVEPKDTRIRLEAHDIYVGLAGAFAVGFAIARMWFGG